MDALKMLSKYTYMIEHQPGCRNPYLVRLIAPNLGCLDRLHHSKTKDICGYGKDLEEAAAKALQKGEALRAQNRGTIRHRR